MVMLSTTVEEENNDTNNIEIALFLMKKSHKYCVFRIFYIILRSQIKFRFIMASFQNQQNQQGALYNAITAESLEGLNRELLNGLLLLCGDFGRQFERWIGIV